MLESKWFTEIDKLIIKLYYRVLKTIFESFFGGESISQCR